MLNVAANILHEQEGGAEVRHLQRRLDAHGLAQAAYDYFAANLLYGGDGIDMVRLVGTAEFGVPEGWGG